MSDSATSNITEFSVSEIAQDLKRTVEQAFGRVRVRGEVSGYRGPHASGHAYFALKDEKARLEAVVWRGVFSGLPMKPEEGMEVIATGKLTTYPGSSKYQIVVDQLEPAGVGALMALLEERRKKLSAEGLFDPERKRALPYLPGVIGVVTSPTGAVIRDILHRLSDRFPVRVVVWPVRVQGETSGAEVSAAVSGFNALEPLGPIARPDLLIVARGGGSLEDLWGFNDEAVVRAVAASSIPVISAVGHETDWTLIDHAADVRAPTPTGAAEMAVPVRSELIATVDDLARRLTGAQLRGLERHRERLSGLARALPRPEELVALARQRFDAAALRLDQSLVRACERQRARYDRLADRLRSEPLRVRLATLQERIVLMDTRRARAQATLVREHRAQLSSVSKLLESLSYKSVLARGFAVVRDTSDRPHSDTTSIPEGAELTIELREGRFGATAHGSYDTSSEIAEQGPAAQHKSVSKDASVKDVLKPRRRSKSKATDHDDQGELF